nr:pyruvate formate lyase family protein [Spiroplasma mirum]
MFTKYSKTNNQGVFDAYTEDMRACRKSHIISSLPDAYGRGRIIGDYRRLALYGADYLIAKKEEDKRNTSLVMMEDVICLWEELLEQILELKEIKKWRFNMDLMFQNKRPMSKKLSNEHI